VGLNRGHSGDGQNCIFNTFGGQKVNFVFEGGDKLSQASFENEYLKSFKTEFKPCIVK